MNNLQNGVLLLLKSAILGEKYELPEGFDLREASELAIAHQIENLVLDGAVNCGIDPQRAEMQKLLKRGYALLAVNERQLFVINDLFAKFDENKIDYMPLKGTVLKNVYPKPEMRSMSDADVLIRVEQYDRISQIMQDSGFVFQKETEHELIWTKAHVMIELHKQTMSTWNADYLKYFGDGWKFAKLESNCRFAMSNEDFYIFLFIHLAKHYRVGGIGVKHMLDLWVYRNAFKLDEQYIQEKMDILQLKEFHGNLMATLECWFQEGTPTDKTDLITSVIFNSGAYGSAEMEFIAKAVRLSAKKGKKWSVKRARTNQITKAVFLPYEHMCRKFPVLVKAPILLPAYWIVRIFRVLFSDYKFVQKKLKLWKKGNLQSVKAYEQAMHYVGLDFRFEE